MRRESYSSPCPQVPLGPCSKIYRAGPVTGTGVSSAPQIRFLPTRRTSIWESSRGPGHIVLRDGSMTSRTRRGRRFVEKNGLAFDYTCQLVASLATDIAMHAFQGERGPLVVVEQRRLPSCRIVTSSAGRNAPFGKLPPMNILVALLTFGRRLGKIYVLQGGLHVGRFVAVHAGGCPVRAE